MGKIPADELAEAVEHLRERLDGCKRGFGDVPQSLTDHAIEIVLAELERLRALVAGFPDGWTAEDEATRLRFAGESTREHLRLLDENREMRETIVRERAVLVQQAVELKELRER